MAGRSDSSGGSDTKAPWYAEGLKFRCTQCGDCCTGSPGFVWISAEEVEGLAARVGVSVDEFERLYTRKIGARKSLKEFPNGDCVFFDSERRRCSVYEQRPRQCRTWPFWSSNLQSPEKWEETCESCPGSGKGRLYTLEEIETQRKVVRI